MLEDEFPEMEEQYTRAEKTEVFENLYRNALEQHIKWRHPVMKTTEQKEIDEHCTFKPDINNTNTVESKIIGRIKRVEVAKNVKNQKYEQINTLQLKNIIQARAQGRGPRYFYLKCCLFNCSLLVCCFVVYWIILINEVRATIYTCVDRVWCMHNIIYLYKKMNVP